MREITLQIAHEQRRCGDQTTAKVCAKHLETHGLPEFWRTTGQVAIKVRAASVSLPDLMMIKGQHPLIKSTPFSPGIEVAGTVSAVGNGAPLADGDRVMTTTAYATGWGGLAEYSRRRHQSRARSFTYD